MEDRRSPLSILFFSIYLLFNITTTSVVVAYKNYTVGESLGWYDNTEKPVNYQNWVAGKTFSLGDFLIFNTNNNHSVIQTFNLTTYKNCDYDNALENDTILYTTQNPSNTNTQTVAVEVPLLKIGSTYFLSSDYDGDQCRNGMHFGINVTYGQGLPESLKDHSHDNEAPSPTSQVSGEDEAVPDTIVPSSFDHPKDISDDGDNEQSQSVSITDIPKFFGIQLHAILILIGLFSKFFDLVI